MEITKVIGIAFIAIFIILVLKQYKPEFALQASIVAGIIILFFSVSKLNIIIDVLKSLSNKIDIRLYTKKVISDVKIDIIKLNSPASVKEGEVVISVKDLEVQFSVRNRILTAIRKVSLDIYKGETIAIVG